METAPKRRAGKKVLLAERKAVVADEKGAGFHPEEELGQWFGVLQWKRLDLHPLL